MIVAQSRNEGMKTEQEVWLVAGKILKNKSLKAFWNLILEKIWTKLKRATATRRFHFYSITQDPIINLNLCNFESKLW